MKEKIILKAKVRNGTGKGIARKLRQRGMVPAVIYGHNTKPISLSIDEPALKKVAKSEAGLTRLIDLTIENGGEEPIKKIAMIKDIQVGPVKRNYIHVDFYAIQMDEKITVQVKLHLSGKAKGVEEGGILQHTLREIEISCLPERIPEHVDVDISSLKIGDSLHVQDISLPEGIDVLTDSGHVLVTILPPIVEEKKEAPEEAETETETETIKEEV
ncbi:MAG: 50S ribosomal protein L25/general stress protein Ctc [Thermodesulfobacteriota bacterium]|nr:50S ribosomal protein L25/general stress protein Ctc [Thermodesulfobacteriota bacterium]